MDIALKKRLQQTGILLFVVYLIGTFGYYFITRFEYDIFTCFYMTVITLTTIGYDEIINVKDYPGGRPFTVFLAFSGIGILTYFVSSVSTVIVEGQFKQKFKQRIMDKAISKYENHYIICGLGNHSIHLIDELIATERESVCIEIDTEVINDILEKYPAQKYIIGDATHDDVLKRACVEKAKGIFAATNDDNTNLVICLLARRINPNIKIVSLCNNHANDYKIKLAGADYVISPNYMSGLRMASDMLRPVVTHFFDIMLSDKYKNLRIEQIEMKREHIGKTLGDLKLNEFKETIFVALKSKDELVFKPIDTYQILEGDLLLIITTPEERIKLENLAE